MPHPLYALPRVREDRHLTVGSLAARAGVRVATVRRLEQGRRPQTYATWRQLAAALDCDPGELLHLETIAECPICQAYRRRIFPAAEAG